MKQVFNDNIISLIVSLALAVSIWIFATVEKNPEITSTLDTPIQIEVLNKGVGLIITGDIPKQVRVTARAPKDRWDVLNADKFRAYVDLQGLAPGLHEAPIQVECADDLVQIVDQVPKELTVRLDRIKRRDLEVTVKVKDEPPTGFVIQTVTADPPTITIEGPQGLVDEVDKLGAEVWLRGAKEPIERSISLIPRDEQGKPLEGLTVEPQEITARVNVVQKEGYKDVSIRAVITGTVEPGYWISNISVDPATVVIVGDPNVVNEIPGFVETAPVDITSATDTIIRQVQLNLPSDTSLLAQPGIFVTVDIAAIQGGQTVQRPIIAQGLSPWLEVLSLSPDTVDIILSGSLPEFTDFNYDDVRAVVDLQELEPGTYKVEPIASVPPESQVRVVNITPNAVEVVIANLIVTRELKIPLTLVGVGLGQRAIVPVEAISITFQDTTAALQNISPDTVQAIVPLTGVGLGLHVITPIIATTTGARIHAIAPPTMTVRITYTIDTKTLVIPVKIESLAADLKLKTDIQPLSLTLQGPALEIFNVTTAAIAAMVDLTELDVGTHELVPTITLPPSLTIVQIEPDVVSVAIYQLSTATPTPSATFTPTPVPPTATATRAPVATRVLIRTPSPTPEKTYPAPILLAPDDGAALSGIDTQIQLRWRSVGTLAEDEWYDVQVWRIGEQPSGAVWTKATSWLVNRRYYNGVILWRVGVIRGVGGKVRRNLSPYSETRRFDWAR